MKKYKGLFIWYSTGILIPILPVVMIYTVGGSNVYYAALIGSAIVMVVSIITAIIASRYKANYSSVGSVSPQLLLRLIEFGAITTTLGFVGIFVSFWLALTF